MLFLKT